MKILFEMKKSYLCCDHSYSFTSSIICLSMSDDLESMVTGLLIFGIYTAVSTGSTDLFDSTDLLYSTEF